MSKKLSIARLKKGGHKFELSVDPDLALKYKQGELENVSVALLAENIYSDANKGQLISEELLENVFNTKDILEIAKIILKEGDIPLTSEHRKEERDKKLRQLINLIHTQAVDPKTKLPHPPNRIEAALKDAKFSLDNYKPVEQQLDDALHKLRPIIPISIEKREICMIIPAEHVGRSYQYVKNNSKILKEEWNSNGAWKIRIEIAAGLYPQFLSNLQDMAHGAVEIIEK